MSNQAMDALTAELARLLQERGLMLSTAESCTGGLIAGACTERPGSSLWFERGFVSYSNESKSELLGVDPALIAQHGAVSQAVAQTMASGAIRHSRAQVALAVTGVAGPSGGSPEKPVGTVWFAWVTPAGLVSERMQFAGDRADVRQATVAHALEKLNALLRHQDAKAVR